MMNRAHELGLTQAKVISNMSMLATPLVDAAELNTKVYELVAMIAEPVTDTELDRLRESLNPLAFKLLAQLEKTKLKLTS